MRSRRISRPSRRSVVIAVLGVVLLAAAGAYLLTLNPPGFVGPRCGHPIAQCREVTGRVLYVQKRDPDGDGDIHLVLLSRDSLTRPLVSVLKLGRFARHGRIPGVGHWVGAIGNVYYGAEGERNLDVWLLRPKG